VGHSRRRIGPEPRRITILAASLLGALGAAGCQPVGVPPATALRRSWLIGVERMRDDAGPQLPYTNRLIADLSAMPNVSVVYAGDDRNSFLFNASKDDKVLVSPWLHTEGHCMNVTYAVYQSGQQRAIFGLAVAWPPAGVEPDSACVDRAARQLYEAMVLQGM
jgi:hypothetical protein